MAILEKRIEQKIIQLVKEGQNDLPGWIVPVCAITLARQTNTSPAKALELAPRHIIVDNIQLELRKKAGKSRFKACVRRAVLEPTIRGVRSPGKSLDEKRLQRLLKNDVIARTQLIFTPVTPSTVNINVHRESIKKRLEERWMHRSEGAELVSNFTPEKICLGENGDILNPLTEIEIKKFDDLISRDNLTLFPKVPTTGSPRERIITFIGSMCSQPDLLHINKILKEENPVFSVAALPCLNPNPFVTDHPEKNIGINVPTVLFLLRLNHFATELTKTLNKKVIVRVMSEITAMNSVFDSLEPEQIENGKEKLISILDRFSLKNISLDFLQPNPNLIASPSPTEIAKFTFTFRNSQFDQQIPIPIMLLWSGVINDKTFNNTFGDLGGIKGPDINIKLNAMERKVQLQAEKWAALNQVKWTGFPRGDIQLSIRPGSPKLRFIPVTDHQEDKMPMLPQHCSVAIRKDGSFFTAKRVNFLLNPRKWTEDITEFGNLFIEK
jgi:hypothetical protein